MALDAAGSGTGSGLTKQQQAEMDRWNAMGNYYSSSPTYSPNFTQSSNQGSYTPPTYQSGADQAMFNQAAIQQQLAQQRLEQQKKEEAMYQQYLAWVGTSGQGDQSLVQSQALSPGGTYTTGGGFVPNQEVDMGWQGIGQMPELPVLPKDFTAQDLVDFQKAMDLYQMQTQNLATSGGTYANIEETMAAQQAAASLGIDLTATGGPTYTNPETGESMALALADYDAILSGATPEQQQLLQAGLPETDYDTLSAIFQNLPDEDHNPSWMTQEVYDALLNGKMLEQMLRDAREQAFNAQQVEDYYETPEEIPTTWYDYPYYSFGGGGGYSGSGWEDSDKWWMNLARWRI